MLFFAVVLALAASASGMAHADPKLSAWLRDRQDFLAGRGPDPGPMPTGQSKPPGLPQEASRGQPAVPQPGQTFGQPAGPTPGQIFNQFRASVNSKPDFPQPGQFKAAVMPQPSFTQWTPIDIPGFGDLNARLGTLDSLSLPSSWEQWIAAAPKNLPNGIPREPLPENRGCYGRPSRVEEATPERRP